MFAALPQLSTKYTPSFPGTHVVCCVGAQGAPISSAVQSFPPKNSPLMLVPFTPEVQVPLVVKVHVFSNSCS